MRDGDDGMLSVYIHDNCGIDDDDRRYLFFDPSSFDNLDK